METRIVIVPFEVLFNPVQHDLTPATVPLSIDVLRGFDRDWRKQREPKKGDRKKFTFDEKSVRRVHEAISCEGQERLAEEVEILPLLEPS